MISKPFGKTGLSVTSFGLGLAALGRPGYINLGHNADLGQDKSIKSLRRQSFLVLDAAWALGVRYFDTARSYGRGELFLGEWLKERQIDPNLVVIGSKWGYTYTADWQVTLGRGIKHEVKSHTLPVLEQQIEESKANLAPYINLYQVHSATLESGIMENSAVLDRLAALRNSGLTVGFSVSGPKQNEVILRGIEIERDGLPLFGSVQATWNILEQSAGKALGEAHQAGLGVIIKEGVANGRLTARNSNPTFAKKYALLQLAANEAGLSVDGLALGYIVQQPFVDVVLSGAARKTHLESNLKGMMLSSSEPNRLIYEWKEELVETPVAYWSRRSQLNWN
ncbi:MAG: aldo/keto reductase [Chloroflexota bacterium]